MVSGARLKELGVAVILLGALAPACQAVDSISFEAATGNKTQMVRLAAQWDWNKSWFGANGNHLGGYWDLTAAKWRGNLYREIAGATQSIADIGITPVFRYQRDDGKGLYAEAGIGAHRLSGLYDNDGRRLSTHFQFGDHIGIGYILDSKIDLGLKIQHFSNGGYKKPNSGVNFLVLKAGYSF